MNTVDAIKTPEMRNKIGKLLEKYYGDIYKDFWNLNLNLGLRVTDCLDLTFEDIQESNEGFFINKREGKTGKKRFITLHKPAMKIINKRHNLHPQDEFIFQDHSNRGKAACKPISRVSMARAFKVVGDKLKIRLGTHSCRKSLGWTLHFDNDVKLSVIMKLFNHASEASTKLYLGIDHKDVQDTYQLAAYDPDAPLTKQDSLI